MVVVLEQFPAALAVADILAIPVVHIQYHPAHLFVDKEIPAETAVAARLPVRAAAAAVQALLAAMLLALLPVQEVLVNNGLLAPARTMLAAAADHVAHIMAAQSARAAQAVAVMAAALD